MHTSLIIDNNQHLVANAKILERGILADLGDSPATTKILPSKCITLHHTATSIMSTAKILPSKCMVKLHLPNLTPPKFCITYMVVSTEAFLL